jgi:hypothetical protein
MHFSVLLIACSFVLADEARPPDKPVWLTDYQAALRAARESGKPIFVVFRCTH